MEKEANAGYEILKTSYVGNRKFVLGYNPKAPQPYVTWKSKANDNDYYHGHYFTDKGRAERDFIKRVREEKSYER